MNFFDQFLVPDRDVAVEGAESDVLAVGGPRAAEDPVVVLVFLDVGDLGRPQREIRHSPAEELILRKSHMILERAKIWQPGKSAG